jgi:crotonobetainyl-CoA:carnitine CoA-transferase CaiB-like acyl-CoA transferase
MAALDPADVLIELWSDAGLDEDALENLAFTGNEPVLPSSFAVGTAAQASIGAAALSAAELWRLRSGRRQRVSVEMRDAAIEFRSERYLRVDGKDLDDHHDPIAGLYRCGDGRWARLHTNLPHHRNGLLQLLGCKHDKTAVQQALERWPAEKLETAASEAGLVVTACRSFAEWDAHDQGRAVAGLPLFSVDQIGDGSPLKLASAPRPLAGIKVLELTHVIAGPVGGRVLAGHGADVLLITAAHRPAMLPLVIDTGRGKLSAQIDLRERSGRETLAGLIRDADVFIQGYRPSALAAHGFGPEEVADLRPGIVYASLSAYGHAGPWALRRGFDSLVQTASGLNLAEAEAFGSSEPRALPAQALDHATGYLLAFAVMTALKRRAEQGGSWQVRVSLAQTAHWLRQLGRIDGMYCQDPGFDDVRDRLHETQSGFGLLTAVRHAAAMSETPPHWARASVPLGTHAPAWST